MKKPLSVIAGVAFLALLAVACEGPQGPQGPQGPEGPQGPAGPEGPQGPAGADANENCTQCHVGDTELSARQVQYQASVHRNGGNFERASATYSLATFCAPCHAHEGFVEVVETGAQSTEAGFENPSPINCRTCHQIHTTYTDADYALTTSDPVALWNTDHGTVDFGDGNLCANCHQGRVLSPVPEIDGADVDITSSRYGYHHGTQAQTLGGTGYFEFTGSATITGGPNSHGDVASNADGCVTCHMASAWGNQAGGHTWNMQYLYHGGVEDNIAGCQTSGCHSASLTDFDYAGVHDNVALMLDSLEVLLTAIGIHDGTGHAVTGTWSANIAAGYLNWLTAEEDRSHGIHNPPYIQAVLTNTIEVLEPLAPAPGNQ